MSRTTEAAVALSRQAHQKIGRRRIGLFQQNRPFSDVTGLADDVRLRGDWVAKLPLMRIANRDSVGGRHRRERRMMGRREEGQGQFFYSFDLDKVIPPDCGRLTVCSI